MPILQHHPKAVNKASFASRVWSALRLMEKNSRLLRPGDKVLAAVSGGPDSACLAHYLASRRKALGIEIAFAYVNHGLRGRSADLDGELVRRLGRLWGVPVSLLRADVPSYIKKRRLGLEDAARAARYEALAREARRLGFKTLATAHHLDDQAETVLLHLLRGLSLAGLGAMAPERPLAGLRLVRPFLTLRRSDILSYAARHGVPYRIDRSNLSKKRLRNWIRLVLLPLLGQRQPRIHEHLSQLAAAVRRTGPRTF